jgi:hypothetical protein
MSRVRSSWLWHRVVLSQNTNGSSHSLFHTVYVNLAASPSQPFGYQRHIYTVCPTYKESFQVHRDYSIPLFFYFAIYHSSIAHSIICTRLFRGKMLSDWFNGIEILQGRWQHGEKLGYCYPSGLEKTLCKWDIYTVWQLYNATDFI